MPINFLFAELDVELSAGGSAFDATGGVAFDTTRGFCAEDTPPVPDAHAAPVERLLDALNEGSVVLLLRADRADAGAWLTAPRIDRLLRQALIEPAQTCVWPLTNSVWTISLKGSGDMEQTAQELHVHALRHTLVTHIEAEWQSERQAERQRSEQQARRQPEWAGDSENRPCGSDLEDYADASQEGSAFSLPSVADIHESAFGSAFPSTFAPAFEPVLESAFSVTAVAPLRAMEGVEDNLAELNALLAILVNKQLHAQFQPIVNLHDGQVFGYEALIRGPKGGTLRRPGALFRAAHKARMVAWFDLACQEQCFALAAAQGLRHLLFINMEAEGLAFLDMHDRPLALRARDHNLSPANIVIEITERQAVEDFPRLLQSINQLREQGFKIAIDDAGAGYSSLHVIAELRPDFVKIDRALVRNLDTNGERRALLAALVGYARSIGTHILAEGSETVEELGTLIDLGVTYGQGYLMGKPADTFRGVARDTREFIQTRQRRRQQMLAGRMIRVGELARAGKTLPPDACISVAAASFYKNPSQTSVVVVEDGQVRGLLMRQSLEHILDMARSARMEDLLPQENVAQWMQTDFLRASEEQTASAIARQATTRADLSLECDIVVVNRGGQYVGVTPMRILMEAVTNIQENRMRYADPLTGLPNRVLLEQELAERLEARAPLALARIDLSGLTGYNRCCGLSHGDEAIRALSRLLQNAALSLTAPPNPPLPTDQSGQDAPSAYVRPRAIAETRTAQMQTVPTQTARLQTTRQPTDNDAPDRATASPTRERDGQTDLPPFVAHLGGGGFALLCHPDQAGLLTERILTEFARQHTLLHTDQELRHNGMGPGERGQAARRAPLLACAIAVVTNRARRYTTPTQPMRDSEALLFQVKRQPGSHAVIDRLSDGAHS